jgi:hypothetical protein
MDGACNMIWREEELLWLLVRKPDGKRPLGRPRRRWVDNIKMDFGDRMWCGVDWPGSG